ncbi:MAG: hypothetical protein AABX70_07670 [Nanoarchaeota archaeon]
MGLFNTPVKQLILTKEEEETLKQVHMEIYREEQELVQAEKILENLDLMIQRASVLIQQGNLLANEINQLGKGISDATSAGRIIGDPYKQRYLEKNRACSVITQELQGILDIIGQFADRFIASENTQKTILSKLSIEAIVMRNALTKLNATLNSSSLTINTGFQTTSYVS